MWPIIIGAAMGLMKSNEQRKQAQAMSEVEATKELGSPWSGRGGRTVTPPDRSSPVMKGIMAGWMQQQKMGGDDNSVTGDKSVASTDMQSDDYWDNWASGGVADNTQYSKPAGPQQMTPQEQYAANMTADPSWNNPPLVDPGYIDYPAAGDRHQQQLAYNRRTGLEPRR